VVVIDIRVYLCSKDFRVRIFRMRLHWLLLSATAEAFRSLLAMLYVITIVMVSSSSEELDRLNSFTRYLL
jgi:hypothetical protein